jgi:hypothetical protein
MANLFETISTAVARGAVNSPAVQVNKDRLGVVVHDGYAVKDTIVANKYPMFVAGCIGMAFSGYAAWKRKSHEARILYAITGLMSAGLAYAARPWVKPAPPGSTSTSSAAIGYLDRRARALRRQDPQFAERSLSRLLKDSSLDKIPTLQALVQG